MVPAAELFVVDVLDAPRRGRVTRALLTLVVGIVTLGSSPTNLGGRRIRVLGRTSRMEIAVWPEPLAALDADDFARRWIAGTGQGGAATRGDR